MMDTFDVWLNSVQERSGFDTLKSIKTWLNLRLTENSNMHATLFIKKEKKFSSLRHHLLHSYLLKIEFIFWTVTALLTFSRISGVFEGRCSLFKNGILALKKEKII